MEADAPSSHYIREKVECCVEVSRRILQHVTHQVHTTTADWLAAALASWWTSTCLRATALNLPASAFEGFYSQLECESVLRWHMTQSQTKRQLEHTESRSEATNAKKKKHTTRLWGAQPWRRHARVNIERTALRKRCPSTKPCQPDNTLNTAEDSHIRGE